MGGGTDHAGDQVPELWDFGSGGAEALAPGPATSQSFNLGYFILVALTELSVPRKYAHTSQKPVDSTQKYEPLPNECHVYKF